VLLLLAVVVGGYRWLGVASFAIGLIAFMLFELLNPPPRYRKFGADQIQQALDKSYREDEPDPESSRKVGRNDPCPCGSGVKFKRCCGRTSK